MGLLRQVFVQVLVQGLVVQRRRSPISFCVNTAVGRALSSCECFWCEGDTESVKLRKPLLAHFCKMHFHMAGKGSKRKNPGKLSCWQDFLLLYRI